jgi:3-hydroxyacyl-CoA dehydrogenase/enoyl-CoA hydratase/3-hydroxybutyryl-CoA epimerase
MDPTSSAMIRTLFLGKQALEKGANRPEAADQTVRKLGVLGAGMMGAGIALVAAQAGIDVVLLDQSREAAEKGRAHTADYAEKGVRRGKTTPEKAEAMLARIHATDDVADLAGCDLIVEAVFEDAGVKAEITARVEKALPNDTIFATNTSTLPITDLAKASKRPEDFIGIHFFSPVEKMMLVEIIKGQRTGDRAVAKALDFVRQIRKTPIVVNDARFFYANRCIIPYLNEGARMVTEGVAPALIENAAKLMGFPLGPLQLIDETSIDLAVKISRATKAAMGGAYPADMAPVDDLMTWLAGAGRLGRKAGAGFYVYDDKGKRTGLWPGLAERHPALGDQPDLTEVQHRLMFVQVLEAVRALEEGVLMDIREGDVGAILGWGFAPWSGGPFSWLDMLGTPYAAARCDELAARHGARFACPALLRGMAERGERFHGRFAAPGGSG